MRHSLTAAILVACIAVPVAVTSRQRLLGPADVNALPSKAADARVSYGEAPMQFGDLRLPKGAGPFPLAIVIHGGCFISKIASLQNSAAMADALRDAGLATWNIEYRGIDVDELTITDVGHFEVIATNSTAWPRVREAILRFAHVAAPK